MAVLAAALSLHFIMCSEDHTHGDLIKWPHTSLALILRNVRSLEKHSVVIATLPTNPSLQQYCTYRVWKTLNRVGLIYMYLTQYQGHVALETSAKILAMVTLKASSLID